MEDELHGVILRARRGDQEAFANLVRQFKDQVYRYAWGMLHDRMDAEDVSQEAFVKAYYAIASLEHEYAFSAWLFRIVANLCRDRLKKRGKAVLAHEDTLEMVEDSGSRDLSAKLTMEAMLATLSADHREVILLHDVQGYRYEEIAQLLHVPLGTVKSRLFAARMALRKQIRKEDA